MGKLYAEYIRQEPEVLGTILARREALAASFTAFARERPFRRVFLLGSGSSWHCGLVCRDLIQDMTGVECTCLTSTMAQGFPFRREDLYIAVSQSGTSNSTLGLMERLQAMGAHVAALTAEFRSPIARKADLVVPVLCGAETIGPKSKGVLATIATLALLFLALGRGTRRLDQSGYEGQIAALERARGDVADAIQAGEGFFRRCREELLSAGELMLVAGPERIGAARECALKVLETCRVPALAYEFEEYMHGPHYTLGPGRHIFYLLPQGPDRTRMLALYRFGAEQGAIGWLLDLEERDGAFRVPGDRGDIPGALSYIAFFQALSQCLSEAAGVDCDRPRYPEFHARMGTKTLDQE